jgi:hypothetical protein
MLAVPVHFNRIKIDKAPEKIGYGNIQPLEKSYKALASQH